ncbi:MAG: laccase domain-containing protein, partial [Anaerolineales bacterium]
MPFRDDSGLRYFQFKSLQDEALVQAIFTRRGGVSPSPWAELNFGRMVGDQEERVAQN